MVVLKAFEQGEWEVKPRDKCSSRTSSSALFAGEYIGGNILKALADDVCKNSFGGGGNIHGEFLAYGEFPAQTYKWWTKTKYEPPFSECDE